MFSFLIVVGIVAYGLHQLSQFVKKDPAKSADIAQWLRRMFDK